jgi:membrane fusion protein, multidrug efflux system
VEFAQVKPRVSGTITAVKFKDGQIVKAGQELFTIDTRPYEAAVAQARAALNSAHSQAKLARVELDRAKALLTQEHVSQSLYDQRASAQQVANAAIGSAEAALRQANLNLEYAHVKAPISGRSGRAELTVGNVAEAGMNAPVLTTILAEDRMYAEFDVDEQTYLTSIRHQQGAGEQPAVEVTLADGEKVYKGRLHSFDNQLDPNSGTIRARALLENADHTMIPGMYAKVRLAQAEARMILLPEAAIGTDQSKKFALVASKDNVVEYRELRLGQQRSPACARAIA